MQIPARVSGDDVRQMLDSIAMFKWVILVIGVLIWQRKRIAQIFDRASGLTLFGQRIELGVASGMPRAGPTTRQVSWFPDW